MSPTHPSRRLSPIVLIRAVLRVLIYVNITLGILIAALLVASLVSDGAVMGALGVRPGPGRAGLVLGMRAIAVVGVLSTPLMHLIFIRLRAFVDSIAAGTPFDAGNAARLKAVAWAVVGLEGLHVAVGIIATRASSPAQPLNLSWNLPVTRLLVVLLLFVLAGVFDEGARMHDELSATV
ncbi:MAG: DUF2975 domain-containing protein [Gemmatimonadales bacterium]